MSIPVNADDPVPIPCMAQQQQQETDGIIHNSNGGGLAIQPPMTKIDRYPNCIPDRKCYLYVTPKLNDDGDMRGLEYHFLKFNDFSNHYAECVGDEWVKFEGDDQLYWMPHAHSCRWISGIWDGTFGWEHSQSYMTFGDGVIEYIDINAQYYEDDVYIEDYCLRVTKDTQPPDNLPVIAPPFQYDFIDLLKINNGAILSN